MVQMGVKEAGYRYLNLLLQLEQFLTIMSLHIDLLGKVSFEERELIFRSINLKEYFSGPSYLTSYF